MLTLDASAALSLVMKVQVAKDKWEKLATLVEEADCIIAPDLFVVETSNVFWKYHRFEKLPFDRATQFRSDCLSLVNKIVDCSALIDEAFHLACQAKHSVYDACYLICARRFSAPLVTFDKKLVKIADSFGVPHMEL